MADMLTRLPDELLINIFSYLDLPSRPESIHNWLIDDVRPSLYALSLTCSRLSHVAREFMLRDVRLATGCVGAFGPPYSTQRLQEYTRICRENPTTMLLARTLEMQCDFPANPNWGTPEDEQAPDDVLLALSKSPALVSIRILISGARNIQWFPSLLPHHHEGMLFSGVKELYIDCGRGRIPVSIFLGISMLPSLKRIETSSEVVHHGFATVAAHELVSHSASFIKKHHSNVESMTITAPVIHGFAIGMLIDKMPNLTDLHVSVPGPGVRCDHVESPRNSLRNRLVTGFSPVQLNHKLRPAIDTLCSMSLVHPQILVGLHDHSQLDLSQYSRLQHLKLSIHYLCPISLGDASRTAPPSPIQQVPRVDFYKLFPPSLQTLEIHYDSYQGIFYDPQQLYQIIRYYDTENDIANFGTVLDVPKSAVLPTIYNELWYNGFGNLNGEKGVRRRLDWLLNLAVIQDIVLPKLTKVTVRETYIRDWDWQDLDLAEIHPDLFAYCSLKINVVLRVPRGWVRPDRYVQPEVEDCETSAEVEQEGFDRV